MEIQFLGTSAGVPTKARNVSGLAIRACDAGHWYLVDCGEGTQHRLLAAGLSLATLRGVFITHVHGDHCYGLPGLLATAGMQNRTEPLLVAGPSAVRELMDNVLKLTQVCLPYRLEYLDVEHDRVLPDLPDVEVRVSALSHRVASFAYSFCEKHRRGKLNTAKLLAHGIPRGPLWHRIQQGESLELPDGRSIQATEYRIASVKPRKVIVGGDNDRPELLASEAREADVLIHEATYTEEVLQRIGPGPQHSSARQVAQFAQDAAIPNLVLTHFSPRYSGSSGSQRGRQSLADLEAEARAVYRGRLFLAEDLAMYRPDGNGSLSEASAGKQLPKR